MMEQDGFKNYCVLKTFGVRRSEVQPFLSSGSVSVDFSEDCLDGTILIVNGEGDEVEFQAAVDKLKGAFSDKIYADEDVSLAKKLVEVCRENAVRLAVAESLTGGMICSRLVDVPGASEVLNEGVTAYSNRAKVRRLNVKEETLKEFGAVSSQTAFQMAAGLLEDPETDIAVSTTGLAGPKSDDSKKPVGLAYIAVGGRSGIHVHKMNFSGNREEITETAKNTALLYAIAYIREGGL